MCLGVPARVIEVVAQQQAARVEVDGRPRNISIAALDDPVEAGDWVLVYAGMAMQKIDEIEARELSQFLEGFGQEITREGREGISAGPEAPE